ncbi:MAG: helix-turn-helix domain-containing protein [Puniceicoccales bacterium]|jgi:hypothetical protein|nr:helix-turn-helix domain-containing protein [Puniceicoccales bacterium]
MQTLGETLSEARQRIGARIQDAADATHIRRDYLEALENNQFDLITLADVYRRGYIKIYARYLRLDIGATLRAYEATEVNTGAASSEFAPKEHGNSRLAVGAHKDGSLSENYNQGAYEQGARHPCDDAEGAAQNSDFSQASVISRGKRPPRHTSAKSRLWLYIISGVALFALCAVVWKVSSPRTPPPAPKAATPLHYSYKMTINTAADTTILVIQDKDKKVIQPRRAMSANSSIVLHAEGPVVIHSPDLGKIHVIVDRLNYTSQNPRNTSFIIDPKPPATGPAAARPK